MGEDCDQRPPSPRQRPPARVGAHDGSFRERSDAELDALPDEDLVRYIATARRVERYDAAGRALAILAWGYEPYINVAVARKVPAHAVETVVERVLDSVARHALAGRPSFAGGSVPEFRSWLDRIIQRRIADFHRDPRQKIERVPLAAEADEGDGVELTTRDEAQAIADKFLVNQALDRLSPPHREVARLYDVEEWSAAEVSAAIPGMSAANIYKISERFRKLLVTMVNE